MEENPDSTHTQICDDLDSCGRDISEAVPCPGKTDSQHFCNLLDVLGHID